MTAIDWTRLFAPARRLVAGASLAPARRLVAAAPIVLCVTGLSMTAASTPRPEASRHAEAVALLTGGAISPEGMARLVAELDSSQRAFAEVALAMQADGDTVRVRRLGLSPGWDSLSLDGKPAPGFGLTGVEARRLNAATPLAAGAIRPAPAFVFRTASAEDSRRALRCLTQAIYYEAALEPTTGQEGVAQVVLNRVRDPNFPDTVCGVVFQGAERTTGCQFSFTCDGSLSRAPAAWAWARAETVAKRALGGHVAVRVGAATHYHADYVRPWWAPTLAKIDQIGAHIFYRWKGPSGEPAALRQAYSGREPLIDEARFARPRLTLPVDPLLAQGDDAALIAAADAGRTATRTVEIDGQTRTVGAASLGGRRQPTRAEVAEINRNLAAYETGETPPAAARPSTPPPGVTAMDVEEVGRPGR